MLFQVPVAELGGLQPLFDLIQPLLAKLSLLIGGIFGLYVLLLVVRVYYERQKVKLLEDIRFNLDTLNTKMKIETSKDKPTIMKKFLRRMKPTIIRPRRKRTKLRKK